MTEVNLAESSACCYIGNDKVVINFVHNDALSED